MPHPVIDPVAGIQYHPQAPKSAPSLQGVTSLRPSESGDSPLLEAHPGSRFDISQSRRPSLPSSLALARSHGSDQDLSRERLKILYNVEELIGKDIGDAVKENEEVRIITTPLTDDGISVDTVMDYGTLDFQFEVDDSGTWVTANPIARESRTSLSTITTNASTLLEDNRYSVCSHGQLTIDTSVASSAASTVSSSSDVYGWEDSWEEEPERKSSVESPNPWESGLPQGRPFPQHHEISRSVTIAGARGRKRKGLLYRVLNISGRRITEGTSTSTSPPEIQLATIT